MGLAGGRIDVRFDRLDIFAGVPKVGLEKSGTNDPSYWLEAVGDANSGSWGLEADEEARAGKFVSNVVSRLVPVPLLFLPAASSARVGISAARSSLSNGGDWPALMPCRGERVADDSLFSNRRSRSTASWRKVVDDAVAEGREVK